MDRIVTKPKWREAKCINLKFWGGKMYVFETQKGKVKKWVFYMEVFCNLALFLFSRKNSIKFKHFFASPTKENKLQRRDINTNTAMKNEKRALKLVDYYRKYHQEIQENNLYLEFTAVSRNFCISSRSFEVIAVANWKTPGTSSKEL